MKDSAIMKNRNVLISGASVAGPALAYWLNRYGFHPTVVELAPKLREGGYKVDIRGVAVEVAERMGIMADIRRMSTNMQGSTFVNSDNKPIVTLPADFLAGRAEGDDEIMRGDLACVLYEHTRDDVEYIFGDSITSIEQSEDGVRVTFERGEPRSFDLVVGADGLHSNVRALSFGDETQFSRYLGAYVSIFTSPNSLNLDHSELYYGSAGKVVCIYSTRDETEAMNLFMFSTPPLAYAHRDVARQKRLLADAFAGERWEVPRLLKAVSDAPDFYFDAMCLIEMDHWSTGRAVLLGDAGYCASPASGQGTGLALVGAYVLAGELAGALGDYGIAFARYESEMRGYVKVNQEFAMKAIKSMIPKSQWQMWFQTQMLRVLPYMPWKNFIVGKIREEIQLAANAVVLKLQYPESGS